jgi:hypothetical protein
MDVATLTNNLLHSEGYIDSNGAPVREMRTRLSGATKKHLWMSFVVFFSRSSSAPARHQFAHSVSARNAKKNN